MEFQVHHAVATGVPLVPDVSTTSVSVRVPGRE